MEVVHYRLIEPKEPQAFDWLKAYRQANPGQSQPVDVNRLFELLMTAPCIKGRQNDHLRHVNDNEQLLIRIFGSDTEPALPFHLPGERGHCACDDLNSLVVEKVHLSGSLRESTDVRVSTDTSDADVMFQVGPVAFADTSNPSSGQNQPGVVLTAETTSNPGFLILKHVRHRSCRHHEQEIFSGDKVLPLLERFRQKLMKHAPEEERSGPALSTRMHVADPLTHFEENKSIDLVLCVKCTKWHNEDYLTRHRPSGQPSPTMVRKLCKMPIFLVPVGFPGSKTFQDEWRVSFSRQEYVMIRLMTDNQRSCFLLMKSLKPLVYLEHLKSYFLKTAIMWLCENRKEAEWSDRNTYQSLLLILRYIETCVKHRWMPCYFWPEINIFASKSEHDLKQILEEVKKLREHLLSCSFAILSGWLGPGVEQLIPRFLWDSPPASPAGDFGDLIARNLTQRCGEGGVWDVWDTCRGSLKRIVAATVGSEEMFMSVWPTLPYLIRSLITADGILAEADTERDNVKLMMAYLVSYIQAFSIAWDTLIPGPSQLRDSWMPED